MKPCKSSQIRNPATNRCVKKSGKIGKKLLKSKSPRRRSSSRRASPRVSPPRRVSPQVAVSPRRKPCKPDEIRNPATKRCVKKSGKIGKKLLKSLSPKPLSKKVSSKKKSPKKSSPKKKSPTPKKSSPKKEMGFDVIMQEERPVDEFLAEDMDNIVIRIKNTNYLSNKDYFANQGVFIECKRIAQTDPVDILKSIDFTKKGLFQMNSIGIPGGYVYLEDINAMIMSVHQKYTVTPTSRKTVSIASKTVADILQQPIHMRPQGYLVSAVHCGPGEEHVIHKLVEF